MRMTRVAVIAIAAAGAACGASARKGPYLATKVGGERWFASPARCSQGPFELEATATGNRWGEGIELVVSTPRRVRLTAVIDVDGVEVARMTNTVGPSDPAAEQSGQPAQPENQRCV